MVAAILPTAEPGKAEQAAAGTASVRISAGA
jgi:hypothetical protein